MLTKTEQRLSADFEEGLDLSFLHIYQKYKQKEEPQMSNARNLRVVNPHAKKEPTMEHTPSAPKVQRGALIKDVLSMRKTCKLGFPMITPIYATSEKNSAQKSEQFQNSMTSKIKQIVFHLSNWCRWKHNLNLHITAQHRTLQKRPAFHTTNTVSAGDQHATRCIPDQPKLLPGVHGEFIVPSMPYVPS